MAQAINNLDFTLDSSTVHLWQYNAAEKLNAILQGTGDFFQTAVGDFWRSYYDDVFNIATAKGYGLDLWGWTLGVVRPIYTADGVTAAVSDDIYRRMLIGTIYKYNMVGTMPEILSYIEYILPDMPLVIRDNLDMTITIMVVNDITPEEMAVFTSDGFFPRPAGVELTFAAFSPDETFGFAGSDLAGFDVGIFAY